jgi:DNA-binding NarL/FixJ family response regulator
LKTHYQITPDWIEDITIELKIRCLPKRPIRLMLVDDSLPVRLRLRSLIQESCPCEIVGEAASCADALKLFHIHQPEAVVLDVALSDGTGLNVLQEIKRIRPGCCVIMLTSNTLSEFREKSRVLGANFYFIKHLDAERVSQALQDTCRPFSAL